MKTYKVASLVLACLFAATGGLFLAAPEGVLNLFNTLSPFLGQPEAPIAGLSLYLVLAVGYMYTVTVLAWLMYRHPGNRHFPWLLAHAKIASSILSLALFLVQDHYLIYLANFAVDAIIGAAVVWLMVGKGGQRQWVSS